MHDDKTTTTTKRIILVLDESGSMSSQKQQIINGVNEMIQSQRKLQTKTVNLSIVKFNTTVINLPSNTLNNIRQFTSSNYCPDGLTALYDAVGLTINKYSHETGNIMVIVTDGEENSSKEFTQQQMINMINEQRINKKWNFIYLSEDPTTVRQGNSMGITNAAFGCSNTCVGAQQSGKAIGSESLQTYIHDLSSGQTQQNYNDWQSHRFSHQRHPIHFPSSPHLRCHGQWSSQIYHR